ncbi:hypothetical protein [Legionella sp. CNM-4043-24]|uniref:hypothetical protein n=1 Tax=Legionella sp. CNM-4043-24 TaxID=3421646 RepID=UPI00403A98C4
MLQRSQAFYLHNIGHSKSIRAAISASCDTADSSDSTPSMEDILRANRTEELLSLHAKLREKILLDSTPGNLLALFEDLDQLVKFARECSSPELAAKCWYLRACCQFSVDVAHDLRKCTGRNTAPYSLSKAVSLGYVDSLRAADTMNAFYNDRREAILSRAREKLGLPPLLKTDLPSRSLAIQNRRCPDEHAIKKARQLLEKALNLAPGYDHARMESPRDMAPPVTDCSSSSLSGSR